LSTCWALVGTVGAADGGGAWRMPVQYQDSGGDSGPADVWTVDSDYLDAAARELDALHDFVVNSFLPHFHEIADRMGTQDHNPFGGPKVSDAVALWMKHDQYLTAARHTYASIADQLKNAADATRQVAQQYRTTEERNRANMADVEKAFGQHSGSPSGGAVPDPQSTSSKGFD
jgi:hypothetical protein